MIEVHLIGYTADLQHLVLDVDASEERGRYRLVVDGDLFATLDDMRVARWEQGLDVGPWEPEDVEWVELDEHAEAPVDEALDDEVEADAEVEAEDNSDPVDADLTAPMAAVEPDPVPVAAVAVPAVEAQVAETEDEEEFDLGAVAREAVAIDTFDDLVLEEDERVAPSAEGWDDLDDFAPEDADEFAADVAEVDPEPILEVTGELALYDDGEVDEDDEVEYVYEELDEDELARLDAEGIEYELVELPEAEAEPELEPEPLLDAPPEPRSVDPSPTTTFDDLGLGDPDDDLEELLGSDQPLPAVRMVPAPPPPPVVAEPEPEPVATEDVDAFDEASEPEAPEPAPVARTVPANGHRNGHVNGHGNGHVNGTVDPEVAPYPPIRRPVGGQRPDTRVANGTSALDSDVPAATHLPSSERRRINPDGVEVPANARLTPAQIQAELRAGTPLKSVAEKAQTSEAWVRRWLEPIEAERQRIIDQARSLVVAAGDERSAVPLGRAVASRLASRGLDVDEVVWDAARRQDGTWRISCRFTEKGRTRTASWLLPRGGRDLKAASPLAREVGWLDKPARKRTPARAR